MGFGVLFAGYFLLLNIAYYLITDVIAAALIALGLSKLSFINRGFKSALIVSFAFLAFSLIEFGFGAYEMLFSSIDNPMLVSYGAILRHVLLCVLSLTALEGMREVATEVGLASLAKKCRIYAYLALPVYIFAIVAETPALFQWTTTYIAAIIAVIAMLATLLHMIFALTAIFGCYSKICMPEESKQSNNSKKTQNKSESFIDAYRRQRDERETAKAERKKNN